jgi:hypothetical protein
MRNAPVTNPATGLTRSPSIVLTCRRHLVFILRSASGPYTASLIEDRLEGGKVSIRKRLGRVVAVCAAAVTVFAGFTATPAQAWPGAELNRAVYGVNGQLLGRATWFSADTGYYWNGLIEVHDLFCDQDNGIIAALYAFRGGEWQRTTLASVRGCGSSNYVDVKKAPAGPYVGDRIRFRVCKRLPNGTWVDCYDQYAINEPA